MNSTSADLDRWAAACERAATECEQAELLLIDAGDFGALQHVTRARETVFTTYRAMVDAGAAPSNGAGVSAPVPLHLLDTLNARRLLRALQEAADLAEAVDQERGWTMADGTPCGLSETISDMAERLRLEVEGPAGGGRE